MEVVNTTDHPSDRICFPNKIEDANFSVFNVMTKINESVVLSKHISCECKCKFDDIKCNSNQKWNNNIYQCKGKNPRKKITFVKTIRFGIPVHVLVKMVNL